MGDGIYVKALRAWFGETLVLKGVDLTSGKAPSAEVIAKLTKLSSEIDTAALSKASANIGAWAQKNCTAK